MRSGLDSYDEGGMARGAGLNRVERSGLFREMVLMELRGGRLGTVRRQRLLAYGRKLGMEAVDARRILTEVEIETGARPMPTFDTAAGFDLLSRSDDWPVWFKVSFALIVATILDLIIIRTFFE